MSYFIIENEIVIMEIGMRAHLTIKKGQHINVTAFFLEEKKMDKETAFQKR